MYQAHNGDSLEIMRQMAAESVDLVITSPPYNLLNSSGGGFSGIKDHTWKNPALKNGYDGHDDQMPREEYVAWQKSILTECWRLLKPTGAIYYNHKPRVQAGLYEMPLELNPGLPLRQILIWRRAGGINYSPTFYMSTHEWIMIFAKPDFRLKNKGVSGMGDVWTMIQERNNPHPASFPLTLPSKILESAPAQTVLDPFMGSGTTGVACIQHGVQFIGIEKSERYFNMAKYRLDRAIAKDYTSWTTHFDENCEQVSQPAFNLESMFQ